MKEGYRDVQKSVTLSEQQKLTVSLDALTPIQGNLSVSYRPIGADIYLDGKKSATTPYVFNGLLVGSHTIEIRKNGYASETKTVTVSEGQTASLQGSLKEIASATTAQTANQNSSSLSGNGQTFTVNGVSFTMIPVEGGTFIMGETATGWNAYHSVTLSNYMIGETEVTQAFWRAVMGKNPSKYKGNNRPVERVNWNDCQKFIDKLNSLTGKRFRLPTEAEWEYASKGGNNGCGNWYSGSNTIGEVAWYFGNSDGSGTHDVKTKSPNELGIYDMSGNVMEWCSDWYSSYSSSSQSNPTGVDSGTYRVCRGGGFLSSDDYCSSSKRQFILPDSRIFYHGLRLALSE
ncbi:MAG: SUMF1/EgtB/PvdO family nonheme iron enzyme [Prevotellaceae bacterium]|nr:SUMF1/EgtB/PvdO family nonheme iron enzyme [Candidatus Minthosoma caballi]